MLDGELDVDSWPATVTSFFLIREWSDEVTSWRRAIRALWENYKSRESSRDIKIRKIHVTMSKCEEKTNFYVLAGHRKRCRMIIVNGGTSALSAL